VVLQTITHHIIYKKNKTP